MEARQVRYKPNQTSKEKTQQSLRKLMKAPRPRRARGGGGRRSLRRVCGVRALWEAEGKGEPAEMQTPTHGMTATALFLKEAHRPRALLYGKAAKHGGGPACHATHSPPTSHSSLQGLLHLLGPLHHPRPLRGDSVETGQPPAGRPSVGSSAVLGLGGPAALGGRPWGQVG